MKSRLLAAAAMGAALFTTSAATAASPWSSTPQSAFSQCDGFGMPSSGGDGMTGYAMIWGIFNPPGYGTGAKGDTTADGGSGVASCDAALADPHLKPTYWMRRVNLLKARALHNLERNDWAGALADLDRAQAAVQDPNDPFYQRSLGVGLDLVHAYALRRSGRVEEGVALARDAAARRPYSRLVMLSALLAMGPEASEPGAEATRRALARVHPTLVNDLFIDAFQAGRWSEVTALFGQQTVPIKYETVSVPGVGVWRVPRVNRAEAELFWIGRAGGTAYALAAQGRGAEARALLAEAARRLDLAAAPKPAPVDPLVKPTDAANRTKLRQYKEAKDEWVRWEQARIGIEKYGRPALEGWVRRVEQRLQVDEGKAEQVFAGLKAQPPSRGAAGLDLVQALDARLPPAMKDAHAALADLKTRLVTARERFPEVDASHMFHSLPDAETAKRLTTFKKTTPGFFGSIVGFTVEPAKVTGSGWGAPDPDAMTVSFRSQSSPQGIVQEMALLRAAYLAKEKGFGGFIILSAEDTEYTVSTTQYGQVLRSDPDGYGTDLVVVLVDPAHLPERYRDTAWRVLDTDAAIAALSPIYQPPEPAKPKKGRS